MTTALEGDEGSASWPSRSLPPGKTWYPLYRRLGGPQGRSEQVRKISPLPGFDPRTSSQYPVAIPTTLPGPHKLDRRLAKRGAVQSDRNCRILLYVRYFYCNNNECYVVPAKDSSAAVASSSICYWLFSQNSDLTLEEVFCGISDCIIMPDTWDVTIKMHCTWRNVICASNELETGLVNIDVFYIIVTCAALNKQRICRCVRKNCGKRKLAPSCLFCPSVWIESLWYLRIFVKFDI